MWKPNPAVLVGGVKVSANRPPPPPATSSTVPAWPYAWCVTCGVYVKACGYQGPTSLNTTHGTLWKFQCGANNIVYVPESAIQQQQGHPINIGHPYSNQPAAYYPNVLPPDVEQKVTKCECGSTACGSPKHSEWCPLWE